MREIKFRAWDDAEKRMVWPDKIDRRGLAWWMEHSVPECSKVIMQYTGLKDKNGKEIYEGDIIEIKHPYKDRQFRGAVEWQPPRFGVAEFCFTHYDDPSNCFEDMKYVEVVGNIHQQ